MFNLILNLRDFEAKSDMFFKSPISSVHCRVISHSFQLTHKGLRMNRKEKHTHIPVLHAQPCHAFVEKKQLPDRYSGVNSTCARLGSELRNSKKQSVSPCSVSHRCFYH